MVRLSPPPERVAPPPPTTLSARAAIGAAARAVRRAKEANPVLRAMALSLRFRGSSILLVATLRGLSWPFCRPGVPACTITLALQPVRLRHTNDIGPPKKVAFEGKSCPGPAVGEVRSPASMAAIYAQRGAVAQHAAATG